MKNFVGASALANVLCLARVNYVAFPAVLQCLAVVGGKEKIGVRKRIPGKEKQEKTRCANKPLRVTEDVDVDIRHTKK